MRWLFVGLVMASGSLLPHRELDAQARPVVRLGESPPDSAAWRPLLDYIIGNLAPNLLDAAIDTTSQPWIMSFPTTGAVWPAIEAHLRTALRARPAMPGDTVVYELKIGDLTVRADTARVRVITGVTRPCPGSTRSGGYGNVDNVFVVRYKAGIADRTRFWGSARTAGVLHGDRFGCPTARP